MGSNMRPRYIQFRDIHNRDISGVHCIYIHDPFFGIVVPADVLAPYGDRPSAGIVLTTLLLMFLAKFLCLSLIWNHLFGLHDILKNGLKLSES